MISAYDQHGRSKEALQIFESMKLQGLQINETTIICVPKACTHSGLSKEAFEIFYNLEARYKIKPDIRHCNCIVEVLGRVGRLEDAENFIMTYMKKRQIEPNLVTWTSLLAACRVFMDIERAERISEYIMKLDPEDESPYLLLSNIYARFGDLSKAKNIRKLMDARGVRKIVDLSIVEVNGKLYQFVINDSSHPKIKEIHHQLQLLTEEIIKAGYNPENNWVMHDLSDEQPSKELYYHSERLAMIWALINAPSGAPIYLTKNSRICDDCHNATKFISKVRNHEIIMKDTFRCHHFKDGICSCGEYW
jgi:pentatricopeptide repeat protein